MWAVTGAGDNPEEDTGQGFWRIDGDGNGTLLVNLFALEAKSNPHPATVDSNPFDVEDLGDGEALVADAGANALLKIDKHGKAKVVAVLPDELVSTANAEELLGEDFPPMLPAQPVSRASRLAPTGPTTLAS